MRTARPILFSGPMVRALLAGTKTQTRRLVKGVPVFVLPFIGRDDVPTGEFGLCLTHDRVINKHVMCPYGAPGDLLVVRETFRLAAEFDDRKPTLARPNSPAHYNADGRADEGWGKTRVSIHMPRWASRLTLEITEVRVERLQEISADDALSEGVREPSLGGPLTVIDHGNLFKVERSDTNPLVLWQFLWRQINGDVSWDANPWVWAVSFKVHHQNVDAFLARAA